MFYGFACMVFGVASLFLPAPGPVVCLVLALASGVLYVRAMNRRARRDAQ
jgi:hypothetical protein